MVLLAHAARARMTNSVRSHGSVGGWSVPGRTEIRERGWSTSGPQREDLPDYQLGKSLPVPADHLRGRRPAAKRRCPQECPPVTVIGRTYGHVTGHDETGRRGV